MWKEVKKYCIFELITIALILYTIHFLKKRFSHLTHNQRNIFEAIKSTPTPTSPTPTPTSPKVNENNLQLEISEKESLQFKTVTELKEMAEKYNIEKTEIKGLKKEQLINKIQEYI
jgi:hypothetical protein